MNIKKKAALAFCVIVSLGISTAKLNTHCQRPDKKHVDEKVTRCPYSQADLERAHKKTPDRASEHTCFFCNCPKQEHSES